MMFPLGNAETRGEAFGFIGEAKIRCQALTAEAILPSTQISGSICG
jgi:hypothetical protein